MEVKNSTKLTTSFYTSPWCSSDTTECDSSKTKRQLKKDFTELEYESDDSQGTSYSESVEDFAAIPEQFRPKKSHRNPIYVTENHTQVDSFSVKSSKVNSNPVKSESVYSKDNINESKRTSQAKKTVIHESQCWDPNYTFGNSTFKAVRLENKEQTKILPVPSKPTTEPKKVHFDHRLETTNSNVMQKKNSIRMKTSSPNEFKTSFETLRINDNIKSNKPIWDSNMSFHNEKSQIWKLNGYSRTRTKNTCDGKLLTSAVKVEKEISGSKDVKSKETGDSRKNAVGTCNRKNIAWDDSMCLLKNNKKVTFNYISKEVKDGSSTITACWGDVQQRATRIGPRRSFPRNNRVYRRRGHKQSTEFERDNEIPQNPLASETNKQQTYSATKTKDKSVTPNRSKKYQKSKTTVIRHEIKVIHVNEPSCSSSEITKDQGDVLLKNLVSQGVGNCIFQCGKSCENQLNPKQCVAVKQEAENSSSIHSDAKKETILQMTERDLPQATLNISKADIEHKRNTLIQYGKEISDLIAGSYVLVMTLLSFYDKWLPMRNKTIELLERLADNVSNITRRDKKIKEVSDFIECGSKVATAIPDFRVAIVGKVIATLSSIFSKLFQSSPSLEHSGVKESEMMRYLQEDIEATSDLYMYGIQCDQQFQEVCKIIEEFQHFIDGGDLTAIVDSPEADFIQEMSHFSPNSYIVYYRKLYKCFEKLKNKQTSDVSKAFCRAFEDIPSATAVINQLHWRFHALVTDSAIAERAWEDVCVLLISSNSNSEILLKIRDCIRILMHERNVMEKNIAELIKHKF